MSDATTKQNKFLADSKIKKQVVDSVDGLLPHEDAVFLDESDPFDPDDTFDDIEEMVPWTPVPLTRKASERNIGSAESLVSVYGEPVSAEKAQIACPPGDGGLKYHSQLVSAKWTHPKDTDENGVIRPRRPTLPIRVDDFFDSLVKTNDGRYLFSGVLNGWPGLTCLEVRSITTLSSWLGNTQVVRFWNANAKKQVNLETLRERLTKLLSEKAKSVRVTLRAAPWSARGWTASSPGCVWWYESQRQDGDGGPRLSHGEDMIRNLQADLAAGRYGGKEPECTKIHMFAHRYARPGKQGKETTKQNLTYHGAILVEWSHGEHVTVIELATLNGVGGRSGKANWYHDKLEDHPELYRNMPPCMIMPWQGQYAEIRVHDVEAKTLEEFQAYMKQYEGPELRFLDTHWTLSAPVRVSHRYQTDIQRYLLNYMGRDMRYSEAFRNCQTFAADFYGFMAGKQGVVPFHELNRISYQNRAHNFLYTPEMYGPPHR